MSSHLTPEIVPRIAVEGELRAILAALGDALIAADVRGCVTFMNPLAETLTGWPEEQAKGRALAEIFPCPEPGALIARGGARILVEQRTAPLDGGGAVLVFREIVTGGHAVARAQTERAARLQEVTAACSEAHVPADVAAVVVTQGCAALGAPRGFMYVLTEDGAALEVAQGIECPPAAVDAWRRIPIEIDAPVAEAVRTGEALFFESAEAMLTRYPNLAGAQLPGDHAVATVPLAVDGRLLGALGFVFGEDRPFDAEERRFILALARQCARALERARLYEAAALARAAAEAANRAKDDFLATLSHELRTPLTSILGWANVLRTRTPEPAALARTLQIIERNAKTLVQLIEDILDVSRIVAGKLRLELRLVEPAAIVRGAIDAVRPSAEAKQVTLEAAIDDGIGALMADPDRLQQITWNLLSNAVKFTPRGGRVEVRLDRIGAEVRLQVIDAGAGIDADFLPRVFERFRQADSSNTRAHGGLGLGLAIVKHLVELHEGTITAASGGVGLGATFTVTLPLSLRTGDAPGGSWVADPVTEVPSRLDGVRVLIVDDDPDARELIATILQGQGASVEVAASAAEALRAVELVRPDVLISDIGMPDEDGYALLKKVRALSREHEGQVPALALTAYAGVHDARMAELAGFRRHLAKPVVPARLIDTVAWLAGQGEARGPVHGSER